jgi:Xaa-Pro aminopeptidase
VSASTTSASVVPRFAPLEIPRRIPRLRALLEEANADALLVTNLVNVRYLTGFSGSAAELLVDPNCALLVTDGRYRTQAAEQLAAAGVAESVELQVGKVQAQRDAIAAAARDGGASRVALEADHVTWASKRRLAEMLSPAEVVATEGMVQQLRVEKDRGELDRMETAASIADEALGEVLPMLADGPTEERFALALDSAMRRLGAEDRAFDTIVASGPNAAKPHHRPSARVVSKGDPVVVDFGAVCEGYRSDMTRTFCVGGEPKGDLAKVFSVVAEAQAAGVSAVRAGVSAGEVDHACRRIVAAAGWADEFEHGTGHGVGLDIHEPPAVAEGCTTVLGERYVVTVEPGVYLRGYCGVRIEDTVVVTPEGCRVLTRFTKQAALPPG